MAYVERGTLSISNQLFAISMLMDWFITSGFGNILVFFLLFSASLKDRFRRIGDFCSIVVFSNDPAIIFDSL